MPATHPRVFLGLLAALCGLAGCRVTEPERVVAGHHELCCKAANPDNLGFVGCRASSSCRTSERVWVRGPVTCAPADPQHCSGGRCCQLDLEALAILELDPTEVVDGPDDTEDPEVPKPEPTPEPALIVPVPLDWQGRPQAITIPKLVCPVTLERGIEGSVELRIDVDASGHVTEVSIRKGTDPVCDELAQQALLHAEFEPARAPDGQPIASSVTWVYQFMTDPPASREGSLRERPSGYPSLDLRFTRDGGS